MGFNNTDCHDLVYPDELHQAQKGDQEHLLDLFVDILDPAELKAVNAEVLACRPFSGEPHCKGCVSGVHASVGHSHGTWRLLPDW